MPAAGESRYAFVTVFYEDEYELLRLQARSIRQYVDPEILEKIIVIDNSERPLPKNWKNDLLEDYGTLSHQVEIVQARDIARLPWNTGWRTQQILKLAVARIVPTERYLLLDSKNHIVFSLTRKALESHDGRPRTHLHGYVRHPLRGHLERVLAYYQLDPPAHVARFTATVTPFVMHTQIVRDMMMDLEHREHTTFERAFTKRTLTEFFAYAGFIIASGQNLAELYDFEQTAASCIWGNAAGSADVRKTLAQVLTKQIPFFSVHRLAIAKLDNDSRNMIAEFWRNRSLFATTDEAIALLSRLQSQYLSKNPTRPFWRAMKVIEQKWPRRTRHRMQS